MDLKKIARIAALGLTLAAMLAQTAPTATPTPGKNN
jgi:hypothetical protein